MDIDSKLTMTESFSRYFSVSLAETPGQKKDVYKIRYRVYCEEFKYESLDEFPDQLEFDEYDAISRHCLITHNETGVPAGCVRLVPALGPAEESPLPFEKHCGDSLDSRLIDSMRLDRKTVCEISRLAVDGRFRRRTGEGLTRYGEMSSLDLSLQEQRACSLIAVAGFFSGNVLTEMENRGNMFAMMEPFLPRLLKRSGIFFERVGKDIDYHGIRAPYFCTSQSVLDNMYQDEVREFYHWLRENIHKHS